MQQSKLNQPLNIDLDKIPSIPHALLQLLEVIRDPDSRFTKITEIIQSDPALATRVMSTASSGAFYQWNQNKDLNRLLVAMGLKLVKNIAINSAVQQFFSQFNVDNEGLLAQFWQTSLTTAVIARALSHMIGYPNEDEAYISGLLHNVGELICLTHDTNAYAKLTKQHKNQYQECSLVEFHSQRNTMEQNFIGASIPEIGHLIIQGFAPDSMMGDAILYQRETAEKITGAPHLVQLINLAGKLASLNEQQEPESQISPIVLENRESIFKEVARIFGLNQPLLEEMLLKSHSEFLKIAQSMGISVDNNNRIKFDNEQVQLDLADNVRTIALSSSLQKINTCQLESRSEKNLIIQIIQNLRILFGLSHFVYLTYDEESRQLKILPVATCKTNTNKQLELVEQLNISLDASMTLPVQAMHKGIPVTSQGILQGESGNNKKTVPDRQLLRAMNAEEMLCIPLLDKDRNRKFGVIVVGLSPMQLQKIKHEKGLLYEFSIAASDVISQDRILAEQLQSIMEEQHSLQATQIRKLVHEAKNPLGVIRNYLQVLSIKLSDSTDPKLQGQLEILMSEVERVGEIVLRIREVPQSSENDISQVDINQIINQLVSIFQESIFLKSGINTNIKLDASIPLIESNSNTLKQILTNLFKNAAEAMPDGGEINISTRDQVNFNGEQFIELCVSDSGPGIPKEILNNLFNPVKSTKSGEHSGLGLSIIKNLVNDLGGTIGGSNRSSMQGSSNSVRQENPGAEFIILLPRRLLTQ